MTPTTPPDHGAARADSASHWALQAQRALIVALAYGLLGKACLVLSGPSTQWAPLWLPLGVLMALWMRWGGASVAGVLVAASALLVDPNVSRPLLLALIAGDLCGALLGAWGLHRVAINPRLDRRGDVGLLLTVSLLAAAVGAAVGVAVLSIAGSIDPSSSLRWLLLGVLARWIGALLGAVPLMALHREAWRQAFAPARRVSTVLMLGMAAVSAALAFGMDAGRSVLPLALACLPAALLSGLVVHAGVGLASAVAAALSLGVAYAASLALGPLSPAWAPSSLAPTWAYAAVLVGSLLLVHVLTRDSLSVEKRWLLALGGAGLGVGEWTLGRDEGRASQQWKLLSGDDSASLSSWLSRVHDDDRPGLQQSMERLRAGTQSRAQCEIRVPCEDGWRWLDAQLLVVERDHQGQASRLIATLSDSSERHDAQERQRLSSSLFQHLHEGLLIADADLRVLDVNPAYTQILGTTRQELIGSVPPMLRPSPPDPLVRQQRLLMWSALRSTGSWRGEVVERRRNGEACALQVTISTVNDADGRVRYHVLVISDITEQRQQRDRLERQAHFDELTRLPNRARLMEMLAEAMTAADADGYLLTVCYLDLDRFKPVNDRFGHAAGDRLLVELAGRLRSALRSNEVWSDAAGRLGGDEFVLLLRATTMEESRLAVERVLRVVAQPYVIDPNVDPVQVTASMGATVYPIDRSDADTLLRHADHAMYGAKQAGRNGYQFFDPENRRRNEERVMAIGRVQEALDKSEFTLYYQPKVDMRRGVVLGLEALVRWDHPQHGLIAPMQFLPLIENTGLSSRVGDWVLGQALEHLAMWRRAGHDISVSVNVSARHLQEPDFALRLSELLARYPDAPATALELEVLETAAHADIEATSALLARCRAIGVRFALDDFGTGYSTLTYLKQLPVDVLKIDRSFVHHMLDDAQDRAIVEGVIGLARTFQCVVVAEGVESPAQARTLLDMGCNDAGRGGVGLDTRLQGPVRAGRGPGHAGLPGSRQLTAGCTAALSRLRR
ncbi:MAG: EAL domain-containing protein [Burkholderiaceae bacterium]|nr:EAL domain-containing protein [Burkholderiaceae bacterium]